MANEVKWLIPKRLGFFSMEGNISSAEFVRINDEMMDLIEAGESPIHLIADVSRLTRVPMDIQWIARKTAIRDEKVGIVVAVGANSLLKFMAQMIKSLTKSNIHMCASMEEAYALIQKEDSTISTIQNS
jgi:hypothetical protein